MSKFKVGDKVRVIVDGHVSKHWHCYCVGDIHTIVKDYGNGEYEVGHQTMVEQDIELITTANQIEVGVTYTTREHGQFNCIAVTGTHAWLTVGNAGTAYVWTIEGKSLLGGEWDIIFPPHIEVKHEAITVAGKPITIRYEVIDGVADLDNATIAPF